MIKKLLIISLLISIIVLAGCTPRTTETSLNSEEAKEVSTNEGRTELVEEVIVGEETEAPAEE
ncbi:hypothetical protein GOV06_05890 [Candidatus Woesearchaeota archaeon]|nr:hypothetical protein [Candidatus Woesearchaeota archaeon]